MTQRYVWFDDVQRVERVRVECRIPKPLHEFLVRTAQVHDVTLTSLVVGILAYAADADAHRRLRIEQVPSVRVTKFKPGDQPVSVPLLRADDDGRVVYRKRKAL